MYRQMRPLDGTKAMKYAVCNELFTTCSLQDACALTAQYGFQGIEIAPFTLAEDPRTLNSSKTREIKTIIQDAGLQCVGLHWLLKAPQGLHLTTPDVATRQHSWEVFKYLIEFFGHFCQVNILLLFSSKWYGFHIQ